MTLDIHRSGYVRRWHSNPDLAHIAETLAHHHGQVSQIIFELHPNPTIELIYEALHHDCGEMMIGDVPYPAKQHSPELSAILDKSEGEARKKMGCPCEKLSMSDVRWLKFADRLQSYRHVQHTAPHVLKRKDWKDLLDWVMKEADALGISKNVYLIE